MDPDKPGQIMLVSMSVLFISDFSVDQSLPPPPPAPPWQIQLGYFGNGYLAKGIHLLGVGDEVGGMRF
jgi:hypothetical protein